MIAEMDDSRFDEEVAGGPCALLFSSPWCGTCAKVAGRVEAVAARHEGVRVRKMDIARNARAASRFNVLSIPTIVFFKDGKEVHRLSGDVSEPELLEGIRTIL